MRMRYALFSLVLAITWLPSHRAAANECIELWVERNSYFNAIGYCFTTPLARGYFDNSDCTNNSADINSSSAQRVQDIRAREQVLGCDSQRSRWAVADISSWMNRTQSRSTPTPQRVLSPTTEPPASSQFDPNAATARCFELGDGLLVPIGLAYTSSRYRSVGRYNRQTLERVADTPDLQSVSCSQNRRAILFDHQFIREHRYTHEYVGQSLSRAAFTDVVVTSVGDICTADMEVDIFVRGVRSNSNHWMDNPVLFNFYQFIARTHGTPWGIVSWLVGVREVQCSFEERDIQRPNQITLNVFAPEEYAEIYTNDGIFNYDEVIGEYKMIYSGHHIYDSDVFFTNERGERERVQLVDDHPDIRLETIDREYAYQRQVSDLRAARAERVGRIANHIAAFSVAYVQAVFLEFADEGICGFLSAQDISDLDFRSFQSCRQYLFELQQSLQEGSPELYVVGNMLGMTHVNFNSFIEAGSSRQERAARSALSECAAAIVSEYGRAMPNRPPDEQTLLNACAFGAALGGTRAMVFGR